MISRSEESQARQVDRTTYTLGPIRSKPRSASAALHPGHHCLAISEPASAADSLGRGIPPRSAHGTGRLNIAVRLLGLALSLATLAEFAALLLVLSRRVPGLADRAFVLGIGKIAFASLLVASALGLNWLLLDRLIGLETVAWSDSLLILLSGGMLGGLIYFLATLGLGCPEIRPVLDRIPWRRRLQPSDSAAP